METVKTVTISFDEANNITNVFVKQGGFEEDWDIVVHDPEVFLAQPLEQFIDSYCNALTGAECPRCHGKLSPSTIEGYTHQCYNCDEDFYDIETKGIDIFGLR